MSRRGSSLNLNCRHPRIQTFSSFLDGPSDGTPKIYGTKTEETGNQAQKLGSRSGAHTQRDHWRGRRCRAHAVTRHSQLPRPTQTGVCWEPKTVLLWPGENVTWGLETGKSLPTLLENTAGRLYICYCIFDTACRMSVVAQLKGSMTLCWTWPCVTPHPQCLGGHQRTGIKSPWRRPSSRGGEVRLCEEPKRTMLGNPPRCPGGFLEICEEDFKLRKQGSYKSCCVQGRGISLATVISSPSF